MGFVTVNYSLNQTYFVEKNVFEKIVKKAAQNLKTINIKSFEVELLQSENDYRVKAHVDIKKTATYKDALLGFQNEIEKYSFNLIESKPKNITIIVEGEF